MSFETSLKTTGTGGNSYMLVGKLFQRIDPRTMKDLSPINLLVLGTTRRVSSNA